MVKYIIFSLHQQNCKLSNYKRGPHDTSIYLERRGKYLKLCNSLLCACLNIEDAIFEGPMQLSIFFERYFFIVSQGY